MFWRPLASIIHLEETIEGRVLVSHKIKHRGYFLIFTDTREEAEKWCFDHEYDWHNGGTWRTTSTGCCALGR